MSKLGGYEDKPFIAELYDYVPFYTNRPDLEFYLDFAESANGTVLELGCGTGRILIPIAAAGYDITGLDFSDHMLDRCRQKLESQPQDVQKRIRLVKSDMAVFDLPETFSLATAPFRVFQHLISADEQLSCLRCVNNHMEMGGKFVFDLSRAHFRLIKNDAHTEETVDFSDHELPDGCKMRRTHRVVATHLTEQYSDIEFIYYLTQPDGKEERLIQAFSFRHFFRYEVEHLLARCGYSVNHVFGNFDKSPLRDNSPEMIFVAEKVKEFNQCHTSAKKLSRE
jgi:SAM-dependent methyltransferase